MPATWRWPLLLPAPFLAGALQLRQSEGGAGPLVYVYGLDASFREDGRPDCSSRDCAFGGPPVQIGGLEAWSSNQFELPWMIYHRLLNSPRRTKDVREAEVFFVPAWGTGLLGRCAEPAALLAALRQENPRLETEGEHIGPRHILIDSRSTFVCRHMEDLGPGPERLFTRVNLEVANLKWNGAEDLDTHQLIDPDLCAGGRRCRGQPRAWYAFPYPTIYHGPAARAPAATRPRGHATYLWSYFGRIHGKAEVLREALMVECRTSNRCQSGWSPRQEQQGNRSRADFGGLAKRLLQSTFCAQPPGDTPSRKGIIDAIVFGCVPVVFVEEQMALWRAHFTREEFASFAVLVPERYILGSQEPEISAWSRTELASASWPAVPRCVGGGAGGGQHSLEPVLAAIPESELRAKQDALAALAPRVILNLKDGEHDALWTLLERVRAAAGKDGSSLGDERALPRPGVELSTREGVPACDAGEEVRARGRRDAAWRTHFAGDPPALRRAIVAARAAGVKPSFLARSWRRLRKCRRKRLWNATAEC